MQTAIIEQTHETELTTRQTCIHEAGHGLITWMTGNNFYLELGAEVSLDCTGNEYVSLGRCCRGLYVTNQPSAVWKLMILYAGMFAEVRWLELENAGFDQFEEALDNFDNGSDYLEIEAIYEKYFDDTRCFDRAVQEFTKNLIEQHWDKLIVMADLLEERGEIDCGDICERIGYFGFREFHKGIGQEIWHRVQLRIKQAKHDRKRMSQCYRSADSLEKLLA